MFIQICDFFLCWAKKKKKDVFFPPVLFVYVWPSTCLLLCFTEESKWTGHMAHVRTADLNYTFNLFHSNQKIKSNLFSSIGWLSLSACPSVNYKSWIVLLHNPVSSMSHEQKSVITVTDWQVYAHVSNPEAVRIRQAIARMLLTSQSGKDVTSHVNPCFRRLF